MKNKLFLFALICLALVSCEDTLKDTSIFVDEVVNPSSATYALDQWLYGNFVVPYNVDFEYRWNDNATSTSYNLIPARLGKADTVAHLTKYLWFDVYDKVVGPEFIRTYGPRMIQLIGSAAINAAQGTEKLGTAEGGIKIVLYKINAMDINDIEQLNEYIFKTMHHEFSHILHQTKNYPKEYESISAGHYETEGWAGRADTTAWQLGFVSNYGSSQAREDFVEIIANYIVKDDAWWANTLTVAARGKPDPDADETGADIIVEKLEVCTTWLREKYGYELDSIRAEVQRRQSNLDYDMIMHDNY